MTNKATPVQAGIDPLVAEIVKKLENPYLWQKDELEYTDPLCKKAAALLRSQAERITTLTAARDFNARDGYKCGQKLADMEMRAKAAESLLADAREALNKIAGRIIDEGNNSYRQEVTGQKAASIARATLSRLKPGENGGGE